LTHNQEALQTAIASMTRNCQRRIKSVPNLGAELALIAEKRSKLPSRTRMVLEELAGRYKMHCDNKAVL
jgi:hypothetical protein